MKLLTAYILQFSLPLLAYIQTCACRRGVVWVVVPRDFSFSFLRRVRNELEIFLRATSSDTWTHELPCSSRRKNRPPELWIVCKTCWKKSPRFKRSVVASYSGNNSRILAWYLTFPTWVLDNESDPYITSLKPGARIDVSVAVDDDSLSISCSPELSRLQVVGLVAASSEDFLASRYILW